MRSTPMAPSALRIASAPIIGASFDAELRDELGVAVVLLFHVRRELGGGHRLGALHGGRPVPPPLPPGPPPGQHPPGPGVRPPPRAAPRGGEGGRRAAPQP